MNISFRSEPCKELAWKVSRDYSRHYYSTLWMRVLFIVLACVYLHLGWSEWKSPYLMGIWLAAGLFFLEEGLFNFPLIMRCKMYRIRRYYRTQPGFGQSVLYEMTDDFASLSQEEGMSCIKMSWKRVTKVEERPDYFYFVGGRVFLFSCYKKYMTDDQIRELRDWLVSNGKLSADSCGEKVLKYGSGEAIREGDLVMTRGGYREQVMLVIDTQDKRRDAGVDELGAFVTVTSSSNVVMCYEPAIFSGSEDDMVFIERSNILPKYQELYKEWH